MNIDMAKTNTWLKISAVVVLVLLAVCLFSDYVLPILANVVDFLIPLLLPFFLAFILAVLLNPIVNILQRGLKLCRGGAVCIVLALTVVFVTTVLSVMFSGLIKELYVLAADLADPTYGIDIYGMLASFESLYSDVEIFGLINSQTINKCVGFIGNCFVEWSVNALYTVIDVLKSTPSVLFMLLVTAFALYYFCKDENMAMNFVAKLLPKKMECVARKTYANMIDAFMGFVRAQFLLVTVSAVISVVGFLILRTDYVIVMGLLVGFCDLLPVLGPGTVLIPWGIYCLFGGDIFTGVGLLVIYLIVIVVRNLIQPKLISDGVGLHPLATIISLYFGFKIAGVWGLIFGPLVLVVILGIWESVNVTKKTKITGN